MVFEGELAVKEYSEPAHYIDWLDSIGRVIREMDDDRRKGEWVGF
jgi:hypothetical protein